MYTILNLCTSFFLSTCFVIISSTHCKERLGGPIIVYKMCSGSVHAASLLVEIIFYRVALS